MSVDAQRVRDLLEDPLTELEDSLGLAGGDRRLLDSLRQRMAVLLHEDGSAEREIRALLREHYDDGDLRTETYELVRVMLEDQVTEQLRTEPTGQLKAPPAPRERDLVTSQLPVAGDGDDPHATTAAGDGDDSFASTTVIDATSLPPATADDQVQVGSVLRDRFLLQERTSGGSMGVVYKALDRRLAEAGDAEPWVAIKILSPQLSRNGTALRALQQEAAKGRCLSHANIVRFIDLDREDDLYFIVMEWMEGRTLAEILDSEEGKTLGTDEAIRIVRQLANALGYAHRCGIVHADVKPANVMILPNGDVKLFDFGVARVRQSQLKGDQDSFDPGVLGALTPAYSSMQVLTGDEPVAADDVFSLGCLFYRLVAGHRVFGPRNAAEAAAEGMQPQRPQGLSDTQWAALRNAISYSRVTRYQTMSDFMDALDERPESHFAPVPEIDIGPGDDFDMEDAGSSRSWLAGLVALLLLLGFAVYQFGFTDAQESGFSEQVSAWIDEQLAAFRDEPGPGTPGPGAAGEPDPSNEGIVDLPADDGPPIADVEGAPGTDTESAADADDASAEPAPLAEDDDMTAGARTGSEATGTSPGATSQPPADVQVTLTDNLAAQEPVVVTLREDRGPTIVEFQRRGNLDLPLRLRIEEVGYSGNRSPWATGQYMISGDGNLEIPAGETSARVTLEMASDSLREADQGSTLRVRSPDSTTTQFALLEVELEDDDQRAFESGLPMNTIGFAVSQVAVRERDPVVQIDVLRFNPDDTQIVVGYTVGDITAREGEDYFAPGGYSVSFGPGQRTARLLIPLVQDTVREGDEAFTVELATRDAEAVPGVYQRITVTIRDDELPPR